MEFEDARFCEELRDCRQIFEQIEAMEGELNRKVERTMELYGDKIHEMALLRLREAFQRQFEEIETAPPVSLADMVFLSIQMAIADFRSETR